MGLIKSANAPTTLSSFSLKDIEDHARSILLKARLQAEQLLVAAQEEGEAIKKAAHVEGLNEGKKQGMAEGIAAGQKAGAEQALAAHNAALAKLIQSLSTAASSLNAAQNQLQEQAANSVVQLAINIARKATHVRGQSDPSVLMANVETAARLVVESNDVRIVVHPQQRQTLADALPKLKLNWPALAHVEIVDDPSIEPGGCVVRTRGGLIDADLNIQIDRIAAELLP
ncbi:MAG: hypothetical protein JO353_12980 [Phycisphaerae bacterium]|nr:hypothetical protein [Phycisphaerae bacterium]